MDIKQDLPQSSYLELVGFVIADTRASAFVTLLAKVCPDFTWIWFFSTGLYASEKGMALHFLACQQLSNCFFMSDENWCRKTGTASGAHTPGHKLSGREAFRAMNLMWMSYKSEGPGRGGAEVIVYPIIPAPHSLFFFCRGSSNLCRSAQGRVVYAIMFLIFITKNIPISLSNFCGIWDNFAVFFIYHFSWGYSDNLFFKRILSNIFSIFTQNFKLYNSRQKFTGFKIQLLECERDFFCTFKTFVCWDLFLYVCCSTVRLTFLVSF